MKRHGWISVEASLQGFINADLLSELTLTMQRALKIYDIVKTKCLEDGHTYVYQKSVQNIYNSKPDFGRFPRGKDLEETLEELEDRGVLEIEDNK